MLTCREVDRFWDARLDTARAGQSALGVAPSPPGLESHLGRCPRCRARASGFATLVRAIGCLEPVPTPSAGLSSRILAAVEADRRPATVPIRGDARWPSPTLRRVAVAAAGLLILAGLRAMRPGPVRAPVPPIVAPVPVAVAPARPLTEAFAEAAEAAEAIARKTSEPAARLGRDVLDVARSADLVAVASGIEPTGSSVAEERTADGLVKVIGDGLEAGVRPLSRPTQSAFGFLLPNLPRADDPQPPGQGA